MRRFLFAFGFAAVGALALLLPSCIVATAYRPVPAESLTLAPDDLVLVAVTHGRVDGARRGPFDSYSGDVIDSLPDQPGLVGWALRKELFGDEVWTYTVWRDAAALRAFIYGERHGEAMDEASDALVSGRFARFEVRARELPLRWRMVLAKLDEEAPLEVDPSAGAEDGSAR